MKPYICTYEDCRIANKTYGSSKAWWSHERQAHRTKRSWICQKCRTTGKAFVFNTVQDFDVHVGTMHNRPLSAQDLHNLHVRCQQISSPSRRRVHDAAASQHISSWNDSGIAPSVSLLPLSSMKPIGKDSYADLLCPRIRLNHCTGRM